MSGVRPSLFGGLCAAALLLVLALWVGGSATIDFLVLPGVFERLGRTEAAELGNVLFRRWNFVEALCGAVAVLAAFALGREGWGTTRRHVAATALVAAMTLIALVALLYLTPAITDRFEELKRAGVDLADLSRMPPERAALRRLHGVSMILESVKLLSGILALLLIATRRPR